MIKYLVTSVLFFIIEILLFVSFQSNFLEALISIDAEHYHFDKRQEAAFRNVQLIRYNNEKGIKGVYLFGGSSSAVLFPETISFKAAGDTTIYNMTSFGQDLIDILRLVDNIKVPGSSVVLSIYPNKIYSRYTDKRLLRARYLMGVGVSYPVESNIVNSYFKRYTVKSNDIISELLPPINVYASLAGNILRNNYRDMFLMEYIAYTIKIENTFKIQRRDPVRYRKQIENLGKGLSKNTKMRMARSSELLDLIYEAAKKNKLKLIVFETPFGRTYKIILKKEIDGYRQVINKYVKRNRIKYRKFTGPFPFNDNEYFVDGYHVLPSGKVYYKNYVTKGLGDVLGSAGK